MRASSRFAAAAQRRLPARGMRSTAHDREAAEGPVRSRELPPPEEAVAAAAFSLRLSREGRGLHSSQHGECPPGLPHGSARPGASELASCGGAAEEAGPSRGGLGCPGAARRERRKGRSWGLLRRGMMFLVRRLLGPPTRQDGESVWGLGGAAQWVGAAGRGAGRQEVAPEQGPRVGGAGIPRRPLAHGDLSVFLTATRCLLAPCMRVQAPLHGTGAVEMFCGQLVCVLCGMGNSIPLDRVQDAARNQGLFGVFSQDFKQVRSH